MIGDLFRHWPPDSDDYADTKGPNYALRPDLRDVYPVRHGLGWISGTRIDR